MNTALQSWSFGILCFNEKGTLRKVYEQVCLLAGRWNLDAWEVLLVDDGSTDGTAEIIQDITSEDPRAVPILHGTNRGIGAGIRSIYFNAQFENVVFIPGDGQFDVAELTPYREVRAGTFIAFYREENQTYSTFRNMLSWFNKWLNRFLFGIRLRDVNWVKVYKCAELPGLDLRLHSSAIESEICAKLILQGHTPVEVRSNYLPRTYGVSKGASFASILRVIRELGTLWYAVTVFRVQQKRRTA